MLWWKCNGFPARIAVYLYSCKKLCRRVLGCRATRIYALIQKRVTPSRFARRPASRGLRGTPDVVTAMLVAATLAPHCVCCNAGERAAFSGSFRGLELVRSKRRYLVPGERRDAAQSRPPAPRWGIPPSGRTPSGALRRRQPLGHQQHLLPLVSKIIKLFECFVHRTASLVSRN